MMKMWRRKIERNVYLRRLKENDRLRMILSLAAYYILLSIMRVRIVWQERKFVKLDQQERMKNEIRIYHLCGGALYVL